MLYFGVLQLSHHCQKLRLKFSVRDIDSIRVSGWYKSVNTLHQLISNDLRDNSGNRVFAWVFGVRRVASSCNSRPPGLAFDVNDSMVAAGGTEAVDESANPAVSRDADGEIEQGQETADRNLKGKEAENETSDSAHSSRNDPLSSSTKVSEKFQLNRTTVDVIELVAKDLLRRIESEFNVKIRKDRCPNVTETAVLLSVESTSEHGDLSRGFQKLQEVCVDIIRQGVKEVQMKLAADEIALLKTMKLEEMQVALTVSDDICTLYGLQKDLDEAQTRVKRALSRSKGSTAPDNSLTFLLPGGQKVIVKKGNIICENVDVIVNAANGNLEHGGGVAAAICRAAGGHSFQEECRNLVRRKGVVGDGQAVYTDSGSLPFKIIVHAVPPRWYSRDTQSTQRRNTSLLRNACYNSLLVTHGKGGTSVAIPGLGSGIYGIPKDVCAQALLSGTEDFFKKIASSPIKRVVFVDLDDASVTAFKAEASKRYTLVEERHPPPVRRDAKPKAEGMLTQLAKAGRSLMPWLGLLDSGNAKAEEVGSEEQCPICIDRNVNVVLKCNHRFCKECLEKWAKEKPVCPLCYRPFGKITGNQPLGGTMDVSVTRDSLPGYPECGTIAIMYKIPSGVQGNEHPNPGVRYHGTTRTAYLPNNKEGNELLRLLRRAFDARLVFTVGRSVTTGTDNLVTWNDIHHKTSKYGGHTG